MFLLSGVCVVSRNSLFLKMMLYAGESVIKIIKQLGKQNLLIAYSGIFVIIIPAVVLVSL